MTVRRPSPRSGTSGRSPPKRKDGQAEKGAERGVERLSVGGGLGPPAPPVGGAVRLVAHGDVAPTGKQRGVAVEKLHGAA